ncbi:MAG: 4-(cytidine 5'-diphospho)-2-C-methyl-D-erythritol kinase [Clostridia bacterium]|nr:4-(cytidine 5'-diphospho)-2-C-methyl-D-erythritol kinase [Clostridia bacterium]
MQVERANAKLNLLLSVEGKRPDGYHELVSVMQTVSLCDLVTIDYRPESFTKISLDVSGAARLPGDCTNLAYRAAEAFLTATGRRGEVILRLEKHIPMAAGLGGGSADAAAVLRGLNRLCGSPLSKEELCWLGRTLGADVPFCIVGGTSLATGVGEKLSSISPMPQCAIVVACGGKGVSTKEAYAIIDEAKQKRQALPDAIAKAFEEKDLAAAFPCFYNDFETVVEPLRPMVREIKTTMKESGALFSMMSGSGPSVFGIFPDPKTADTCQAALPQKGISAFVCHPTGAYSFD